MPDGTHEPHLYAESVIKAFLDNDKQSMENYIGQFASIESRLGSPIDEHNLAEKKITLETLGAVNQLASDKISSMRHNFVQRPVNRLKDLLGFTVPMTITLYYAVLDYERARHPESSIVTIDRELTRLEEQIYEREIARLEGLARDKAAEPDALMEYTSHNNDVLLGEDTEHHMATTRQFRESVATGRITPAHTTPETAPENNEESAESTRRSTR